MNLADSTGNGKIMISNERQWPHLRRPQQDNRQPYRQNYNYAPPPPRPFVQEDTLKSCEIQIEKKFFTLTLKENPRGRFLRISEDVAGKRNCIIIPGTGLKDFQKLVAEMVKASDEIPATTQSAQECSGV
jgi:hypothetical protein